MKRTDCEKNIRREASRKFYAEEVCWGLTIAINMGLNLEQAMNYISDDFDAWGNLVDWPEQNEVVS